MAARKKKSTTKKSPAKSKVKRVRTDQAAGRQAGKNPTKPKQRPAKPAGRAASSKASKRAKGSEKSSKTVAAKAGKAKAKQGAERERSKAKLELERKKAEIAKERERLRLAAERKKAEIAKEREKVALAKEREKVKLAQEREKVALAKEREKAKLAQERERAKLSEERERAKLAQEREKARLTEERQKAELAKEREKARLAEERENVRLAKERERSAVAEERQRERARKEAERLAEAERLNQERLNAREQKRRELEAEREQQRLERAEERQRLAAEREAERERKIAEKEEAREEARRRKEEERKQREAERESYRKAKEAERERLRAEKEAARRALEGKVARATKSAQRVGGIGRGATARVYRADSIPNQRGTTRATTNYGQSSRGSATGRTGSQRKDGRSARSLPPPKPQAPPVVVTLSVEERYAQILRRISESPPEFQREYAETLDMSWIHHDSALEGVVYTFQELKLAMTPNLTVVPDATMQPVCDEIRRHKAAIELVRDLADKKRIPITVDIVRKIYLTLHPEEGDVKSVRYRKDIPQHRLYFHEYAAPDKILQKVKTCIDWLDGPEPKKLKNPVRIAARVHYDLLRIFPFPVDSGKVARLLMNVLLLRAGYPPAIIHSTERQRYYDALKGSLPIIVAMVNESVLNALQSVEKRLDEIPPTSNVEAQGPPTTPSAPPPPVISTPAPAAAPPSEAAPSAAEAPAAVAPTSTPSSAPSAPPAAAPTS